VRLYAAHVAELDERYADVLAATGYDAVVIHSGSLKKRSEFDDQYWTLRATPHFQHWVPLAQPDCAMVLVPGRKPLLAWTRNDSIWENPPAPETDHFTKGALDVREPKNAGAVSELLPRQGKVAFIGEDRARASTWGFDAVLVNPADLVNPLDRLRTLKTAYEVACLAEANRRAALGHHAVLDAFRAGDRSELELHLIYLSATSQDDPETPYKNIVALGEHAAVLHHVDYRKRTRAGRDAESLLLDAGATYQGYCSDITRTWVKGASAAGSAFTGLVQGVEAMQQRLCAAVKSGSGYEKLHEESHRQVAQILRDVGVTKLGVEEMVTAGLTRTFYPHGLGHSLGLQCHDVGCALIKPKPENPHLRNTSTIAPDQVFTIEPGIYFIAGLLEQLRASPHASAVDFALVEQLATLGGVRIEDDVVVLPADSPGAPVRNLTREVLPAGGGPIA